MFDLELCIAIAFFMVFAEFESLRKRINRLENRVWDLEEKLHLHDKDDI
jgi:polyhydroxyalkanoate synthesis regulator phasin